MCELTRLPLAVTSSVYGCNPVQWANELMQNVQCLMAEQEHHDDQRAHSPRRKTTHDASPDESAKRVTPTQRSYQRGEDEPAKQGDGEVVFVLKPDD